METANLSPEQAAMQEKLKNMSPEELAEFQKKNCIFCQIISGKVQSKKIYEDPKCLAVLDINPSNPGHILLLPKEHYSIMPQMPEDVIGHMFMIAKSLSNIMLKTLKVTGTTIFVANGIAAGQKAQHFMLHVIPRKEGDGLDVLNIPQRQVNENDMVEVHKRLVEKINQVFGIQQEVKEPEEHIEDLKEVAKEEKSAEPEPPKEESKVEESQPEEKEQPAEEAEEDDEEDQEEEDDEEQEDSEDEDEEKEEKDPNLDDIARLLV